VPAVSRQPALILRPWRAADIPALAAEMSREYPTAGMWSRPDERSFRTALPGGAQRRTGQTGERDLRARARTGFARSARRDTTGVGASSTPGTAVLWHC
jgi:hypothetical protein